MAQMELLVDHLLFRIKATLHNNAPILLAVS